MFAPEAFRRIPGFLVRHASVCAIVCALVALPTAASAQDGGMGLSRADRNGVLGLVQWIVPAFDLHDCACMFGVPPVADAGDDVVCQEGDIVVFSGLGSFADPRGEIVSYHWRISSMGIEASGPEVEFVFDRPGWHVVVLTVVDDCGYRAVDQAIVTVSAADPCGGNLAPVADAGSNMQVEVGQVVQFDGSGSFDPDDPSDPDLIVWYDWSFGDAGPEQAGEDVVQPTHVYAQAGTYVVSLRVFDGCDAWDEHEITVTVSDNGGGDPGPLTADFVVRKLLYVDASGEKHWSEPIDLSTEVIDQGLRVLFDARPSNGAAYFYWSFGGGSYGEGDTVEFGLNSSSTVTLDVFDATWMEWDQVSKSVTVAPTMALSYVGPSVGQEANCLAYEGDIAWVSHSQSKISCFDVSNPSQAYELGRFNMPGATAVDVEEGVLFLASNSAGLHLYTANPAGPQHLSTYNTYGSDGQAVYDVVAVQRTAVIAGGAAGVKVLDVTNPTNPLFIAQVSLPGGGYACGLAVWGHTACVRDHFGYVRVVDLTQVDFANPAPSQIAISATLDAMHRNGNLAISDDGVLAYTSWNGIELIDISNAYLPAALGLVPYDPDRPPSGLVFTQQSLYAGISPAVNYSMRVRRINVADVRAPYLMETLLLHASQVAGPILRPVHKDGYVVWCNFYSDIMCVDVAE